MKVVMVGPFGLRPQGTMSRRALPLAKALAENGHQVAVLLPSWSCPEDSGREWEEDGVRIHNIALPAPIPLLREMIITWRLLRCAVAMRPDVIHCFKPKAYAGIVAAAVWGLEKLQLSKIRLVLDSDDWEGKGGWNEIRQYSWAQKLFFAWQERWGMTHCRALTVASRTLERLAQEMGVARGVLHYMPNGVDAEYQVPDADMGGKVRDKWQLGDDPVILLYTRFFEFEPQRVMEVLSRAWAQEPSARLLVVGRGLFGEEECFLSCVREAGFTSRVTHVGWAQGDELLGYFAASDLAVCPFEDTLLNRARCPAKLVDLMAAGLPVVADDVGQAGEYIEHLVSGYLVRPGDVESFATGVVRLLRDGKLRTALGMEARRRMMEGFSWSTLVEVAERAYAA
jgi:glycosyltransferase involved in cell wall biosynthesis